MRYYSIFQTPINIQEIQVLVIKITAALPVSSQGDVAVILRRKAKKKKCIFSVMLLPFKEIKVKLNPS